MLFPFNRKQLGDGFELAMEKSTKTSVFFSSGKRNSANLGFAHRITCVSSLHIPEHYINSKSKLKREGDLEKISWKYFEFVRLSQRAGITSNLMKPLDIALVSLSQLSQFVLLQTALMLPKRCLLHVADRNH